MAKASANLFPYVHLVPAAAPASPAAGSQRLYLDSGNSNKLSRKDSSGTVTVVEGGAGSSASNNEAVAGALLNATSAGDAGSRSDHFSGTSLSGWTTVNVSGTATLTVANSALNVASSGDSYVYKAFTPSGAFTVEARIAANLGNAGDIGIFVTDYTGAATLSTNGNSVTSSLFWNSGSSKYQADATKIAAGTRTSIGSAVDLPAATWIYLRLTRDGSNNVQAFHSVDRARWIAFGSATGLTFTPARIAIRASTAAGASIDFLDVAA